MSQILPDDELLDNLENEAIPQDEEEKKKVGLPAFIISGAFHLFVILLCMLFLISTPKPPSEDIIISTEVIDEFQEEEILEKERDVVKEKVEILTEVVVDTPVITEEIVPDKVTETENEMDSANAEGNPESISDLPLVGSGIVGNIGGGGGGGGSFGQRNGGGKRKAVLRNGGSRQTESAVDAALEWLKRHQEQDGHWETEKYATAPVTKTKDWEPGVTGLAALAFLGAGHTTTVGKYKVTTKKALDWIVKSQTADGCYGSKNPTGVWSYMYNHAICTLAMAEAAGMCSDSEYKISAQRGLDFILASRNEIGIWGYNPKDARFDSSVTGWMSMAVKSAKLAGLNVPHKVFEDVRAHCFNSTPENKESTDPYKEDPTLNYANASPMTNRKGPAMTAIGMLLRMYTGSSGKSEGIRNGAEKLMKVLPRWGASSGIPAITATDADPKWNNEYTWYYGTLTMFQVGGNYWKEWNKALVNTLVPNQRKGGPKDGSLQDVDGSWDTGPGWSPIVGRSYMTAICALNLEVYYRYQSVFKH